jgi:hypothetical protein
MTNFVYPAIIPNNTQIQLLSNTKTYISPISGSIQTIDRGGERWKISLVHRNLRGSNRAVMLAYSSKLNGQQHRIIIHNHAENNRGLLGGVPVINGAGQTGTAVNIDGCAASITNWMREGDFFSINGELKICISDVDSDVVGDATINFAPRLRSAPSDGSSVDTSQGTGTFLLSQSGVSWTNRPGGFSDLSLSIIEDIAA